MNISFIGFGSMAKAIARRLVQEKKHQLSASAPSLVPGINQEGIQTHFDNKHFLKDCQIVIFAVKPMKMDAVFHEIVAEIPSECLIISVAAGLTLDWFTKRITKPHALIRTMPNTPASIGLGATPMIANQTVSKEQKLWAESIFSTIGIIHWVSNEEQMDTFTALSGSGPAYMFSFVAAMAKSAVRLGLEASIAKQFAIQTGIGALKLAENSDLSLSELRTQVTSPGGTTAAALNVLDEHLDELIHASLQAAKNRSQELGRSLA